LWGDKVLFTVKCKHYLASSKLTMNIQWPCYCSCPWLCCLYFCESVRSFWVEVNLCRFCIVCLCMYWILTESMRPPLLNVSLILKTRVNKYIIFFYVTTFYWSCLSKYNAYIFTLENYIINTFSMRWKYLSHRKKN
jgi:hypothetical protein